MMPRGFMTGNEKHCSQYKYLQPRAKWPKKTRKPKAAEDSEESSHSDEAEEGNKSPSPEPEEPTIKLPEEVLKTLYKPPGILLIAGQVSWDLVAKRDNTVANRTHPNLFVFHKYTEQKYRFVASCPSAGHSVLVSDTGEAFTFGRNPWGQLGFGDTTTRDLPEPVPELVGKNIIHAAVGRHHTLFVTDTGTVYACGENKSGQCGLGNTTPRILKPTRIKYNHIIRMKSLDECQFHRGAPIVKVGCGSDFSMILDCNGSLHSFGLPEYGQLGHNSDGSYFVTSTKLTFHFETTPKRISRFFEKSRQKTVVPVEGVDIVDFSCGNNHTVAIDSKKRAFSWGFGGFGRLGHAEQKDEVVPRLIKFFDTQARGVRSVHCGATYSLAVNELGALFMFGQTKRTGEANMYPKPVQDLSGWNIRSIGTSNTSIVIAADDSLIAWGVSPTYGELGTGELNKSTAKPKEVSRMDGLNISQVAMGYSHTLLLCDNSTEEVQQKLANLPTFNP